MESSTVEPMIRPDAEQMLRHLEHLFGGDLDGCHDGRIELAWTDGRSGQLQHAAIFGTDQLESMVERAVQENTKPGQNVYVGQALRHPETPPFGRGKDEDFFALTAFYVDIDDDVVATARENYQHLGCPPTAVVVTGRNPHVRTQMLWRQEVPERDPEVCRRQNRALALALGGDTSVINPSRVLRLGGSVAWPVKPGRVLERTEFLTFDDSRPRIYFPGQLAKAFPPQEEHPAPAMQTGERPSPVTAEFDEANSQPSRPRTLQIGSEFDGITVEACLAEIRAGHQWHNNMVRLTGHWIARGWSDEEILTAASALTLTGYTIEQTRREVAHMITGGRAKWNVPNPVNETEAEDQGHFVLQPIGLLDPSKRPPRNWLVRHRHMRKHTTVTAAAPGVGKSTLAVEEAVSLASGTDFLGFGIDQPRKVALINNEETRDELERRIEAACVRFDVAFASIAETLYLHSGIDAEKLVIVRRGPNDTVLVQPRARQLSTFLRDAGIDLLVLDPFVQLHTVSENSNEEVEQVMVALRDISVAADCALHLVHHTRKPPAGTAHQAGDIFAVRGGGAIVGDAHFVFTLADMGQADADALGIADADRNRFIRLDDAKGKLAPPAGALWFEREGVQMPYGLIGEPVGILVPCAFDCEQRGPSMAAVIAILKDIDRRWNDGDPFSAAPQSPRYVVPMMVETHGLTPSTARRFLRDWIANGMVASRPYDSHTKAHGLQVVSWPG